MKPNSPTRGARKHAAFTLIELLVVIAIIAILAGLLIQTAGFVQEKAGRSRAETEIKAIEAALETYKLDNGSYPVQANPNDKSTVVLIQELALKPINNPEQYGYRKPFEIPVKMLGEYRPGESKDYKKLLEDSDYLQDPFGNPYYYYFDPEKVDGTNSATNSQNNGPHSFDLWSYGKKGKSGSENQPQKWIKNW
jgi:type II secretion system protein G